MKRSMVVVLGLSLLAAVLLSAGTALAEETEFKYSGELRYLGWFVSQNAGDQSFINFRARQRFDANVGDVKGVIRFEIGDAVLGDDVDMGFDEKIIEVKQAYLDIPVYGPVRFKGGGIGYATPWSLVIDNDVPAGQFYADIDGFSIDTTFIKAVEGDTADNDDDETYLSLQADFEAGAASVNPGVALYFASGFDTLIFFPSVAVDTSLGNVEVKIGVAGGFGSDAADNSYAGFAGRLNATVDMGGISPRLFFVFLSGDDDLGDDSMKAYSSFTGDEFIDATNYFYSGGIYGFGVGETVYDLFGAISFGGGFDYSAGPASGSLIVGYHMAAADTGGDQGYGFEVNLSNGIKLAEAAELMTEVDVFVPSDAYGGDAEFAVIAGPKIKW